ncbi:MAG: CPBP family intramembrane metalloprotease [Undibacterium sp.]|nr:CPBP family intramembrane metalloprotease [Opitutaceae bacterium]
MSELPAQIAIGLELALILNGAWLLWRVVFSPSARAERPAPRLNPWSISGTHFLLFLWCVVIGGLIFQLGLSQLLKHASLTTTERLIFVGGAFQFGMLGGIAFFRLILQRNAPIDPPLVTLHPALSGIATFLISLPLLNLVSIVWQSLLQLCGLPAEKQDLIDIFANAKSPGLLTYMIALATLIAPLTEELLFRAGIFRYARTRLPRWAALLVPALLFGALHANLASFAPLVALGIIFSLAYERTGRIGTTIIAHGLFNLNTIALILCGVTA